MCTPYEGRLWTGEVRRVSLDASALLAAALSAASAANFMTTVTTPTGRKLTFRCSARRPTDGEAVHPETRTRCQNRRAVAIATLSLALSPPQWPTVYCSASVTSPSAISPRRLEFA